MRKGYILERTPNERTQLGALTRKGKASARQVARDSVPDGTLSLRGIAAH